MRGVDAPVDHGHDDRSGGLPTGQHLGQRPLDARSGDAIRIQVEVLPAVRRGLGCGGRSQRQGGDRA